MIVIIISVCGAISAASVDHVTLVLQVVAVPREFPPSPPTISGFGWSRAIGQNIFGAPIGQPSGSLLSDWWNERGGVRFLLSVLPAYMLGEKKEKTDGKNCNPQNDHCLVTPRYGNVCTHVETYLFCLPYEVYVAVLFRKFRI